MVTVPTTRPRNVNSWRAAAILYGDWGTSKAYVLGLAFALAGYSSFWFILGISLLMLLVGLNYILVCKFYPNGGGVYASVRHRSEVLSLLGAFFLIADYLVTAALSALAAFHYLGVPNPEHWAILSIGIIGLLNFFGPKHTGSMALGFAIPTVLVVVALGFLSLPFMPQAVHNLQPLSHDFKHDWNAFVGIIVALSGIEAIANTTSSMKLDRGSTLANPSVVKTSTPAIVSVMFEVCIFTVLLGLAMNALPGLQIHGGDVDAPGFPNVRDAMLRYMGETFAGSFFGPTIGHIFGFVISIVIALLLLSAVNTALVALISLLYLLSHDSEVPPFFAKLNRFGVPTYATLISFLLPMSLLLFIQDIAGLADLYAIGFVGAIAVNLSSTSTNFNLPLKISERAFMFGTALIMAFIEFTLFVDKPHARVFVMTIMSLGLLMRSLVREQIEKKVVPPPALPEMPQDEKSMLVAVTAQGKSLDYALQEAQEHNYPLYILFVREQKVITDRDQERVWTEDPTAAELFDHVIRVNQESSRKIPCAFLYTVTAHPAHSIIEIAEQKQVRRIIIGMPRKTVPFLRFLRGSVVRDISAHLPKTIDLHVVY